jgi:hypothetical protein
VWDRLAPLYIEQGVLTSMDQTAFATLCELQADFEKRKRRGDVSLALARMLHSYYIQFGGTPSSRARISVEPKKQESKLERFISGA